MQYRQPLILTGDHDARLQLERKSDDGRSRFEIVKQLWSLMLCEKRERKPNEWTTGWIKNCRAARLLSTFPSDPEVPRQIKIKLPGYLSFRLCCFGGKRREKPRSPAKIKNTKVNKPKEKADQWLNAYVIVKFVNPAIPFGSHCARDALIVF